MLSYFSDIFFSWGFFSFFTFRAPLLKKCGIYSLPQFQAALPHCWPSGSNDAFESACCVNRLFYFLIPYTSFYVVVKEDYNVFFGSQMPFSCKSAARQASWIRFLASMWMSVINKSLLKGAAFVKQSPHLLFHSPHSDSSQPNWLLLRQFLCPKLRPGNTEKRNPSSMHFRWNPDKFSNRKNYTDLKFFGDSVPKGWAGDPLHSFLKPNLDCYVGL